MAYLVYQRILFVVFLSIVQQVYCNHDPDQPLILTPYLESGKIEEARVKSKVSPDINGVESYTGFMTVDKTCGNNLFYWFIPAEVNCEEAPLLLWLTGGPGTSSLFGLFGEVGPFQYDKTTKKLVENKNSWTKYFSIIFLDQPVGTGYSFTEKGCFLKNNVQVAKQVYSFLVQFFTLFPNYQKNNLFLVGDSYTGTYNPAIGVEIDKRNCDGEVKINLKGVLLGNPYMDLSCHHYASYWFETGIIDEGTRDTILKYQETRNRYIKQKNSVEANKYQDMIMAEYASTQLPSQFNTYYDKEINLDFQYYVTDDKIRKQIKVGSTHYNVTSYYGLVGEKFKPEMIVSAVPNVKYLLDKNYLVAFYTGQLDPDCAFSSLVCVLDQLNHQEYKKAKRRAWHVDGRLAGWVRQGGNLMSILVRDAGHLVPRDQGEAALAMVRGVVGSYPATTLDLA